LPENFGTLVADACPEPVVTPGAAVVPEVAALVVLVDEPPPPHAARSGIVTAKVTNVMNILRMKISLKKPPRWRSVLHRPALGATRQATISVRTGKRNKTRCRTTLVLRPP
jgi:hypothetical protein